MFDDFSTYYNVVYKTNIFLILLLSITILIFILHSLNYININIRENAFYIYLLFIIIIYYSIF